MLLDDRPSHPMSCTIELTLDGLVDEELLQAALTEVLPRHPLLVSRIHDDSRGVPCWIPAETWPVLVTDSSRDDSLPELEEPLDLQRAPGLRLRLRSIGERMQLLVHFHHACADGAGIFTFVLEWLAAYGRLQNAGLIPAPLLPVDLSWLKNREPASVRPPLTVLDRCRAILRRIRIALAATGPLAECSESGKSSFENEPRSGIRETRLSEPSFHSLSSSVESSGGTLNDWLLAALLRTCVDWNARHQPFMGKRWMRIMVPVDLRDRNTPGTAANHVSYKFVSRRLGSRVDWAKLLSGIIGEMAIVRTHRTSAHLDWLRRLFRIPAVARWIIHRDSCMATAVLSSLGRVTVAFNSLLPHRDDRFHSGEMIIADIRVAPPKRPGTNFAAVTYRYANEFRIVARDDNQSLTGDALKTFLEQFRSAIMEPVETSAKGDDTPKT